jgi:hypothetical protein
MTTKSRAMRVPASTRKTRRPPRPSTRRSQEQGRQHERRHGHELEEASPGVGQAGGGGDPLGAAEKVTHLDGHEGEEEQVEQAEDGAKLDDAEGEHVGAPQGKVVAGTDQQGDPQQSGS